MHVLYRFPYFSDRLYLKRIPALENQSGLACNSHFIVYEDYSKFIGTYCSHEVIQFLQNLWPQVVITGSLSQLRQTGHSYLDSGWSLSTISFRADMPIGWKKLERK